MAEFPPEDLSFVAVNQRESKVQVKNDGKDEDKPKEDPNDPLLPEPKGI